MSDEHKKMISEISSVLKKLDLESLAFIREQAGVLLYNMEVRERNKENRELSQQNESLIHNSPEKDQAIYFEQLKNGKFFNLCIGKEHIFMDYKEIKALLKIASAAENPSQGALRLYNWFKRERKDVLIDAHIGSASHRALLSIYRELLDTFD
ncbi:hypothetical protein [Spirochaeta isovalerica]|uniref:Uncharacterized protein n=1 Tax=Spirochaeta isovalerica TaxID=150 RepID=A0A841RAU0_9SPIO|nr:hypothetical protein [Spirochaeta isovalerica]MBB6480130.1 hypothetical protein [Spirochaeta isovalerica]